MQIEKSELARKIDKLKSVVPKSSNIAALQGICVCGDKMIAGNGEMTVKAKIGALDQHYRKSEKCHYYKNGKNQKFIPEFSGRILSLLCRAYARRRRESPDPSNRTERGNGSCAVCNSAEKHKHNNDSVIPRS